MPDLTTAQRLAAYRDELTAAGFSSREAWDLVEGVSPSLFEDLEIQADLDGKPAVIGEVKVKMVPHTDVASLSQVRDEIESVLKRGTGDA